MKKYVIKNGKVFFLDNYYFDKPKLVDGGDPDTFEEIGDWFAQDKTRVYFLYVPIEGAEPDSFVCLGGYNDYWAKDGRAAYHFTPSRAARNHKKIETDSLDRFEILPGSRFKEYARDAGKIYYHGKAIRQADAASFEVCTLVNVDDKQDVSPSFHFSRDKNNVYFDGQKITGADRNSFAVVYITESLHNEYGIDINAAYAFNYATRKREMFDHAQIPLVVRDWFAKR